MRSDLKRLRAQRVGLVVHGYGVPHAHLVVVPLHNASDIVSAKYAYIEDGRVRFSEELVPEAPKKILLSVDSERGLRFRIVRATRLRILVRIEERFEMVSKDGLKISRLTNSGLLLYRLIDFQVIENLPRDFCVIRRFAGTVSGREKRGRELYVISARPAACQRF